MEHLVQGRGGRAAGIQVGPGPGRVRRHREVPGRAGDAVHGQACHLQVAADAEAGRAVVVAAIDNLGKGAAGQAIQNANLALGLPETTGLPIDGVAP